MSTILIIDDDPQVYNSIKEEFPGCTIIPEHHNEISYDDEDAVRNYAIQAIKNGADAIIIDIQLKIEDPNDKSGLDIIRSIRRQNDSIEYKIIPIYCYSIHTNDKNKAFEKGATNFFDKNMIGNSERTGELKYLRTSLFALITIYNRALGMTVNFDEVNEQLTEMIGILQSFKGQQYVLLQAVFKLLSLKDITSITELNEENYQAVIEAIGGEEKLLELKKEKLFKENKQQTINLLDDVANVLSGTPFATILRIISGLVKGI